MLNQPLRTVHSVQCGNFSKWYEVLARGKFRLNSNTSGTTSKTFRYSSCSCCNSNKSNGDINKTLSVKKFLNKISPYSKDIINNLKKSDIWKIHLPIANNFISSKDSDEEYVMHSKSDNKEIMTNDEADEVAKALFGSLKNIYLNNLESMKGSKLVFDYVQLLYYKCHKINLSRGESYRDSPDWIKNKKQQ